MSRRSRRVGARLVQYALVFFVAASLNFLLPHLAGGDPIEYQFAGDAGVLSEEAATELRAQFGLDGSLLQQYGAYWAGLAVGDLGLSISQGTPVTGTILARLPWTVLLVACATVSSTLAGLLLGVAAARWRGRRGDAGLVTTVLAVDSMPGFWVGMILISVFAVGLGWFPSFGGVPMGTAFGVVWVIEVLRRLALPVATLTLATTGSVFLLTRASMIDVLDSPYLRHGRAKGVTPRRLLYHHALRNAALPVFTHVMLGIGVLFSGAVVVETVFGYPGLGRLLYGAVIARDYPLLQGGFLLVTVGVLAANVTADLCYPLLDPRVRCQPDAELGS